MPASLVGPVAAWMTHKEQILNKVGSLRGRINLQNARLESHIRNRIAAMNRTNKQSTMSAACLFFSAMK
ncbi:hypothetical protein [Paenibacillus sp. NRS-1760]|uniref:hypothetical protein n=1 Tax=Paenibacillus sp. NRS-1760 TaxID=3233902 RepID=UPI003D2810E0